MIKPSIEWLEQEERELKKEIYQNKRKQVTHRGHTSMRPFVILLFIIALFGSLNAFATEFPIPPVESGKMPQKTWTCKKCGYNNYEGIKGCAVCGRPRNG